MYSNESVLILTGGGPAPGINAVISSVSKCFLENGYRVIGLNGGYEGLFSDKRDYIDIDWHNADDIFDRGGSMLRMSRFKPDEEAFRKNFQIDFFRDNNIRLLVTIGGDDTATTAGHISEFLKEKGYQIANIHVPKTIDNDLPLPAGTPTFGYESAMNEGTRLARTVYEDARTSGNWFVVSSMGRSAGHLAMGIGTACRYPMIIIPEMFDRVEVTVDRIIRLALSTIIKRMSKGIDYGAVMISEGVFHRIDQEELKPYGVHFTLDAHGHIELGKISKALLFNEILESELKRLNLKVRTRPVDIGYDIRCQEPVAYDLSYCTQLGYGVFDLYTKGFTGCMVYVDALGSVRPLQFSDLVDPKTGKIPPRCVDVHGDRVRGIYRHMMDFITPDDYDAAGAFIDDPAYYDFYKILDWKR